MNLPRRLQWLLVVEAAAFAGVVVFAWLRGPHYAKLFGPDELPVGVILNTQVLLLAIWAALGGGSQDVRFAFASLGAVLLLWTPCFFVNLQDLWWLPVIYAGGMFTTPLLLLLRRRAWRVASYPPESVPHAPPWQFSMRLMFVAITLAAVLLACRPLFVWVSGDQYFFKTIGAVIAHVLQAIATAWAVLRAGRPWERIALVTVAVLAAPLMHLDPRLFDALSAMTIALVEEWLLICPLLLVRTLGVRLEVHSATALEPQGAAP